MEGRLVVLVLVLLAGILGVTVWSKPLDQIYKYEKVVLYTAPESSQNDHSLYVDGKRSLVFKVRACESAHLLMAGKVNRADESTYLTIGTSKNTKTILVHTGNWKHTGSTDTPDILHCNELRTFWLSWAYGYIRFGKGSAVGVEMLVEEQQVDELNHQINTISLFTEPGISAVWEIEENQFVNLVTTPKENGDIVSYAWRTVQHAPGDQFSFSIRACQNVKIFLGTSIGVWEYMIKMSATQTMILKGSQELMSNTTDLFDCESFRVIYVSWRMGRITVGSGNTKYKGILVDVADTGIGDVYALGFGAGVDSHATFDFFASIDEMFSFTTVGSSPAVYKNWMHGSEADSLQFLVQACKDVTLVFSDTMGEISDNALILEIAPGGADSVQVKSKNGNVLNSIDEKFLDCNFPTGLWVNFQNNEFRFGRSTMKAFDQIRMRVVAELDGRMVGIGFASGDLDQPAEWTIPTTEPGVLRLITNDNLEAYDTWATGTRRYFKEFRMDKCGDVANVHLTPCQGCRNMGSTGSYHIWFEKDGTSDKISIMNQFQGEFTTVKTTTQSGVTQCGEYRSFFVNWYEDRITLGRGDLTSGQVLVQLDADAELPYVINAIALDSSGETKWEMAMETGEMLSFQKQSSDVGYSWMKMTDELTYQRFWATGSSVILFLGQTYGQTDRGYKITLSSGTSTIERDGQQVASYNGQGKIIDNMNRNYLALSWQDGEIRLGPEIGGNTFMSYTDNSPMTITGLGVDPNGVGAEVRMPHTFLTQTNFKTAPASTLTPAWLDLVHHDNLLFRVKCDGSATITMAPYMFHDDVNTYYQVTIGDNGNKETTIKQNGMLLASADTDNILSADQDASFWIQWYHGEIILGRGERIGSDIIITYYDPSPAPITAAAFDGSSTTEWTVLLAPQGNVFMLEPPSGGGLSGGQVAGIVIGVLILVGVIGGFIYMYKVGKLQRYTNSLVPPGGGSNKPQQFENPISYPNTNSVPAGEASA